MSNLSVNELVENNLNLVKWVICDSITFNERIVGFGFDDLFQEGCIWLWRAAEKYDGKSAAFSTFARVVVRNGIISYCRTMYARDGVPVSIDAGGTMARALAAVDDLDKRISEIDTLSLLESVKTKYSGVARLGIEALELKVRGFSGIEIAEMYGVKQNHVGAWINRAVCKLRTDKRFLAGLS